MRALTISVLLAALPVSALAADRPALAPWIADASGPGRFVSAHGRRSSVMGYPQAGLEAWAWPLQLLSGYHVRFREAGRVDPLDGAALLSRIETRPTEVTRVYVGPDFVVRERIFTPLDAPGAIFTYELEGRPDVQVEARFQPSLDLMWPGALGGQSVDWSEARQGYVEQEPLHGFTAVIRSPQAVAHDDTANAATGRPAASGLVMAPRAEADGVRRAHLIVAQEGAGADAPGAASAWQDAESRLRAEAQAHYAAVLDDAMEVVTPDPEVNRALAASALALEQAWVCAPELGCGEVAGYGPSRPGRRPQYAWFFGGDGLVAVEGLLAAGRPDRARDELAFVARYQNKTDGMVWHEMSLSAPLIDWERRYPYMYVHVDITLQYLSTLADYLDATGDRDFLKAHWPGIAAAWRYAGGLIDPAAHAPRIPAGKQGQNEQAALRDDIRLTSAWIAAADGFARLARAMGDTGSARTAAQAADAARRAVGATGWDAANGFWLEGHTAAGAPVAERRSDAARILVQGAFTPARTDQAFDRLSAPDFLTDWGVRSLSSGDPAYDPNPYSSGAVWALGTSAVAQDFWEAHRPQPAWAAWRGLASWATLDSPGRIHEAAAGDLFHPERESVPEQTWSSAALLTGLTRGLLGLRSRAADGVLEFAPHLPADWGSLALRRVRVGPSRLDLRMTEDVDAVTLDVRGEGPPVALEFAPEIPLGARLLGAEIDGAPAAPVLEAHAQDQHVRLRVPVDGKARRVVIRYTGGVRLSPVRHALLPGDGSLDAKLASARWAGGTLSLHAYVKDGAHAAIDVVTPLAPGAVAGGGIERIAADRLRLTLHPAPDARRGPDGFIPIDAAVTFPAGLTPSAEGR